MGAGNESCMTRECSTCGILGGWEGDCFNTYSKY